MPPFIAELVPSIVTLFKSYFPPDATPEQKAAIEAKAQEMQANLTQILVDSFEKNDEEITKRLQADMSSDSWLSKNIRPLTLIFILIMYSLLSISSGFDFKVTESYITLLGQWGMLIMSFYFGGRTAEKVATIIKGK